MSKESKEKVGKIKKLYQTIEKSSKELSKEAGSLGDIDRWVDIDSEEFKQIENHGWIRRFTLRAIELGAVTVDKAGYIWGSGFPVHADLDGKHVGLRYSKKAVN